MKKIAAPKQMILLTVILLGILSGGCTTQKKAKYVFYFIGDGMGFSQVAITEYYKGYAEGKFGTVPMSFSEFPVLGMAVTHSESNLITDSAASGTALSTGEKTSNGSLGVGSDGKTEFTSIAAAAHQAGYRVGVSSTVQVNHATPAAFYGHSSSRKNYYSIGQEMGQTGYEFFGGGSLRDARGKKGDKASLYDQLTEAGYVLAEGLEEFDRKKDTAEKIYLMQDKGKEETLPYAIDKDDDDMTHADIVKSGIDFLYDKSGKKGFFFMSENGKIDWSCHSNDAKTTILEVMSLSDAVEEALDFYREHADETLIIVTADHETGGFAMNHTGGYDIFFNELDAIDFSKDNQSAEQEGLIEEATRKARLGWTTGTHTGVHVPVFAIGAGSELFSGRMDNTEIPAKIAEAMDIKF